MAGTEYAAGAFHKHLIGHGTPEVELFKAIDKKKKPYALLASQTISGENLHHILKHEPQKLDQLDLHRLHNLLLTAMLINPEDGQPANFIFKPIQTKLGETKYELICIDNDHAFVPPFSTVKKRFSSDTQQVEVKSILFCLNQMQTPIDAQTRNHFLSLKPLAFLQKWLQDLIEQEKHHQKLFATKGQAFEVLFDDQNPVIIPILFAPKTIATLHLKLSRIQSALRQEKVTPLAILQQVAPALGNFYAQAFTQKATPLKRFDVLLGSLFGRDKRGYHTTKTSSDIYKTRGIALAQAKKPKPEYTPEGALTELQKLESQLTPNHLQTVRQAIERGDLKPYLQLLHRDLRRQALGSYQKLSRQTVLQAMSHAAFQTLSLKGLDPSDKDLVSILARSAAGLKHLDLSGCRRLSPKVLLWIQDSCLQLESLILKGWTQLKWVDAANLARGKYDPIPRFSAPLILPKLHTLILDNSSLTTLYIQAPLTRLSLKQAKELTTLSLSTSQLQYLLLDGCKVSQTKIQALIQKQNQLEEVSVKGCPKIAAKFQRCGILLQYSSDHKIHVLADELLEKKEVGLSGKSIDDEIAVAIAKVLPSTKIHTLDVSYNHIDAKGAESLSRVLPSTKIHTLILGYNDIGDAGAESLSRVLPITKIHTLDLRYNHIGDARAEALALVLPSTKIHTLDLRFNKIGNALLKKIQSRLKPKPNEESKQPPKPEADREASPISHSAKQIPIKQPSDSITIAKPNPELGSLLETMYFLLQKHFPMGKLYACDATTQREVAHITSPDYRI